MKRSFDSATEEAFIKAIEASRDEVLEIRAQYSNWFNTYSDLAVPGARTALLNYFDSILYLQIAAIPKIKKIFADVGEIDAREGKIMEQNNLKAEIYLGKSKALLNCIRPLDEENPAYRSLDDLEANLKSLNNSLDQAYYATLYDHYSVNNKYEEIFSKHFRLCSMSITTCS